MTPISIIMPVRNAEPFFEEALASVLSQTYRDFELIVVLDRSTDRSEAIARSLQKRDARIRILDNSGEGLVDALNAGAKTAKGDLLARLDADDRMREGRLERQHDFLLRHLEVVALGSSAVVIDEASREVGRIAVPVADTTLRSRLIRGNPFIHSSMVMRRTAFLAAGGYRDSFPLVEDYDLWLRLARLGGLANIADPLVDYRRHADTVSMQSPARQRLNQQLCILEWKRENGLIETAEFDRRRQDMATLFARIVELAGQPARFGAEDLALFLRSLPHLGGGEARRLVRIVAAARAAGRVSATAARLFRVRAVAISRIGFWRACRAAARRLSLDAAVTLPPLQIEREDDEPR